MVSHRTQRELRRIAERQGGTVSYAQLLGTGLSADEILGMALRGHLIRLRHGVYGIGHAPLTTQGWLFAAQLAAGPHAFLSHRTAAAHRGLCRHPVRVELTVPAGHTPKERPGLRVHRTTIPLDRTHARPHHGLLTATVPRIILDLARTERAGELQRLIREAIRTGQFDLGALRQILAAQPRRLGAGRARAALERYLPGSEDRSSWLETRFQQHVLMDPRLPELRYNQRLLAFEIDVLWPDRRIVLELDGRPYHTAVEDFDRDRAKDRALTREGWRPIRVSDIEWEHDRASVLDDLYALLGT
jgi:very-short-patch-repair endonuclease/predicted transcriptional regulator of viral defense system